VTGADADLDRVAAMNLPAVSYRVTTTQDPVALEDDLILLMVEVRAGRRTARPSNGCCSVVRRVMPTFHPQRSQETP
jgi:hypothetical protein